MKVLITGATGNAGMAVCRLLAAAGYRLRLADLSAPTTELHDLCESIRCDTRTSSDIEAAVAGMDAIVHLAAWHCGHVPPVSDATIFAVNVDGTFNLLEACRRAGGPPVVYASSMAYGWGSVYSVTKVLGEEMCRAYHEMTGASVAILRYHAFVPGPYLEYGARLLRNGVDRQDVATATLAALRGVTEKGIRLFSTIVHTNHHMPADVVNDFTRRGPDWCEGNVPGAGALIEKYDIGLPERVEQHDLSEAEKTIGWSPAVGFLEFLHDLKHRDAEGLEIRELTVPGELPDQHPQPDSIGRGPL